MKRTRGRGGQKLRSQEQVHRSPRHRLSWVRALGAEAPAGQAAGTLSCRLRSSATPSPARLTLRGQQDLAWHLAAFRASVQDDGKGHQTLRPTHLRSLCRPGRRHRARAPSSGPWGELTPLSCARLMPAPDRNATDGRGAPRPVRVEPGGGWVQARSRSLKTCQEEAGW